jgi:hypothetical protein
VRYYDLQANWRKVKRHIAHPTVQAVLVRDMHKFTYGRWKTDFTPGMVPRDVESCDWEWNMRWRGRHPAYWAYVRHSACHWLVNFELELANRVLPDRPWRILSGEKHSTVFDSDETLFDFNYQAMGVPADQCFQNAFDEVYPVGKQLEVGEPPYWRDEIAERTPAEELADTTFLSKCVRSIQTSQRL